MFDPGTIGSRATFKDGEQYPDGIEHVFLNGRQVVDCNRFDGDLRPGTALRRREACEGMRDVAWNAFGFLSQALREVRWARFGLQRWLPRVTTPNIASTSCMPERRLHKSWLRRCCKAVIAGPPCPERVCCA